MHYHLEVVMPPTEDVHAALNRILAPFGEGADDKPGFWDWWVIGGRWSGRKLEAQLDAEKLEAFYAWLKDEGVTVSCFRVGKQELSPADQILKVDAKWREMFPGTTDACPLFAHSSDQYSSESRLPGDIQELGQIHPSTACSRIIFAADEPVEALYMLSQDLWNGLNFMPSAWDGTVTSALSEYKKSLRSYRDDYRDKVEPKDDWLVVTVDYHS